MKTIDELIDEGFDLTFEASRHCEDDDGKPARWYCDLYYGDSNSPWKPGTKHGIGWGMTQQESFEDAQRKMKTKL